MHLRLHPMLRYLRRKQMHLINGHLLGKFHGVVCSELLVSPLIVSTCVRLCEICAVIPLNCFFCGDRLRYLTPASRRLD